MKKVILVFATLVMMVVANSAFASMMDVLTNNSTQYLKNPAGRNAATDAADTAINNPAGTIGMGDGLFVDVSNQVILKTFSSERKDNGDDYESYKSDPIVPNLYLVFNPKGQSWNLWTHVGVLGGGGSLDFPEGGPVVNTMTMGGMATIDKGMHDAAYVAGGGDLDNPATYNPSLAAFNGYFGNPIDAAGPAPSFDSYQKYNFEMIQSSMQICQTLGGSYKLTKDLVLAAGVRFVESKKATEFKYATGGTAKESLVDLELTSFGVGGIFSVNYRVIPELNIGITYESVTKLEYDVDSKRDNAATPEGQLSMGITDALGYVDGKKFNYDLPHRIMVGAQYAVTKDFLVSASFHAVIRAGGVAMEKGTEKSDMIDVEKFAYEIGTGFDWQITDRINWGLGFTYDCINAKEEYFTEAVYKPNLFITGTGISFKVNDALTANVSYSHLFFMEVENKKALAYESNPLGQDLKFKKTGASVALGIQYKFL